MRGTVEEHVKNSDANIRSPRPSFDRDVSADRGRHPEAVSSSPAPLITQSPVLETQTDIQSFRSRPSSPLPPKPVPIDRPPNRLQDTIDDYPHSFIFTNSGRTDDDNRMYSDDVSTPTQSTAPSECGSQDSERSAGFLKPREPRRRRTSTNARTPGERDDGACLLAAPPPPLLRPTTFWKNTPKSALSSPAYSPSTHLIRRSTFVAAGLDLSGPIGDLSALCVESRTPTHTLVLPPETI